MKTLFTLESLKPVAHILDEKGIQFVANGDYLETTESKNGSSANAATQYITQFLEVKPVELEVIEEVA